jgi:hypothetical protein
MTSFVVLPCRMHCFLHHLSPRVGCSGETLKLGIQIRRWQSFSSQGIVWEHVLAELVREGAAWSHGGCLMMHAGRAVTLSDIVATLIVGLARPMR